MGRELCIGACLLVALSACSFPTDTPADGDAGNGGGGVDGGYEGSADDLDTLEGCGGVYNPDQLLEYHFELDSADLSTILADTTYSIYVPAQMWCGDGAPITVGLRRKRSGGERKVGFKVDINELVRGQRFFTLRKLSFENGVSSGNDNDGTDVRAYVAEYLSWRAMVLSGAISSRAAFAGVIINGESFGVYVNVEQVDRSFLKTRLGDNHGWLYKKSGNNDGPRTHKDSFDDPYEEYFCFWRSGNRCPAPSPEVLATELPEKLDIPQMLRMGAVNAIIANTDGPLFKDNNYYWYDWDGGPRVYIPWDLDTSLKADLHVINGGVGGQTSMYTEVLFTHWRDDYVAILGELAEDQLDLAAIIAEIDRAESVAGAAFAADPYVTGSASSAAASLRDYYTTRIATVRAQLAE